MTRAEKITEVRTKLANLTESEKQLLQAKALLTTVEGHILSVYNTIWVYLQAEFSNITPSVVAGYRQWKNANRQVRKGEHGFIIFFPVGAKDNEGFLEGEPEAFYTATVFDISQTEEVKL